ncbi:MAG: hypothetical protein QOE77_4047 [Blastocatellia bacterium]|jgi:hypothetical protein|nr:hypothetical protein [Blastocatellia bacterium]
MRLTLILLSLSLATAAAGASAPSRRAAPDLLRYAGRYPSDRISGISFRTHPLVRAAIDAAAPAGIRGDILSGQVEIPIAVLPNVIIGHSCEAHNCGSHNTSVAIDYRTREAAVCRITDGRNAIWYRDGRVAARNGSCEPEEIPASIRFSM